VGFGGGGLGLAQGSRQFAEQRVIFLVVFNFVVFTPNRMI
jgi:hypothetical protein